MRSRGAPHMSGLSAPMLGVKRLLPLSSGHSIPQLGFGTYRIEPALAGPAVQCALEHGFRHIDCAKIYGNQKEIGAVLAASMRNGVRDASTASPGSGAQKRAVPLAREDLFVVSKLWPTDQHPDHVEAACRETLAELGLDYLDLYLVHWPVAWKRPAKFETHEEKFAVDPATGMSMQDTSVALSDTWKAMEALVDKGLVRSIGVSNCTEAMLDGLAPHCRIAPVTNQVELHPGLPQSQLTAYHGMNGIVTTAYCPLGMPTRFTPPDFQGVAAHPYFTPLSELSGFSPQRLLLNWGISANNVVIVKSTKPEHIRDNSKAQHGALADTVRFAITYFYRVAGETRVMAPTTFRTDGVPPF